MGPSRVLVVSGSGVEAAVEDSDEPVGYLAEGVDEPIVVNVAGRNDSHLPGLPGDRAGPRIVFAIFGAAVTGRGIPEFCEHPGTEDRAETGLAEYDFSVRVLAKMGLHLRLEVRDLRDRHRQYRHG